MYLLGIDIGSSSVKAALVAADNGQVVADAQSPDSEMEMLSLRPGWAEQSPESWWEQVCRAVRRLLEQVPGASDQVAGIGIAYQMHGLVVVDKEQKVLRPSIIWCDSRAVEIGNEAFEAMGPERCLNHLLNSPGNFTASKLKWVQENEIDIYQRIDKIMLPGDYIAMRLTGEVKTTPEGLSEGILWDFAKDDLADMVLSHYGFATGLIPEVVPVFSIQGRLGSEAAAATGLQTGTPVSYRAGDQPNNALSLGVLQPGQVAATGGTSGVVYGVLERPLADPLSRVNGFAHVNHSPGNPRIGVLLCINGAGITYSWLRQQVAQDGITYDDMERQAEEVVPGSDGLRILPFGNGAERMLENRSPGAQVLGLQFNRHGRPHLYRAALEGIAFSFVYGVKILQNMGVRVTNMRVGNDNLFRSAVFSKTIATLLRCTIEVVETNGAAGAARAAGVATGFYASAEEAVATNKVLMQYGPAEAFEGCLEAYEDWELKLGKFL
ncbi:MAG: hypothetical protein RI973_1238 [Bacteroidota bacterium]|jgi:xylulokinase